VSEADVRFLRTLLAAHPSASRRELSLRLCEAWQWVQPNGVPADAVCRGLLLALHRAGHIELPPPRSHCPRPWVRRRPAPLDLPQTPRLGTLADLGELEIRQVRRTPEDAYVNGMLEQYHYLGYAQPVGEHLKYLIRAQGQPIACLCYASAPLRLGLRDRYIGWSDSVRQANLRNIAYQSRFLILPWVKVRYLASHLLGCISRRLSEDWQKLYAHPIYFTETFVDFERYPGTCYRAANWVCLGVTTGRGTKAKKGRPTVSRKLTFGYPLVRDFRRRLGVIE
jgi:hypothetical protein